MSKKKPRTRQEASPEAECDATQGPARDEPAALRAERDDLLGRLQRVSADYLNYQKRVQRDISHGREFANEDLMKALLGVLDDMERALKAARADHSADDALLKGMQLVHDKAVETLGKFGLAAIEAVGLPFDPELHAAMMQEPSAEHPPRTVLKELQKGYQLKGRTLRPSAVVVSADPSDEATSPGDDEEDAQE